MHDNDLNKILDYIEKLKPEAIELMKAIVPIKALGPLNDGDGEKEKAEYIINYLKSCGITNIKEFPSQDATVPGGLRPNLVAHIPGKSHSSKVWILCHLDVVPEGDRSKWDTDPFEAVVKDGRIYGRGTEDNHQGLVSAVMTLRAFNESGIQPNHDLGVVFVSDEETGSTHGLQFLINHHADLFSKEDWIIVPDAGEPDGSMVEVAEKSILWIKFKTIGKQVHASIPEKGINAFKAAGHLLVKLQELHQRFGDRDEVFDPPISTFEPTKKEANVPNINTIPGDDVFYLDCRILPQYEIAQILDEVKTISSAIEKQFQVTIEISTSQKEQAAPPTPADAAVVIALKSAIQQVYGIRAEARGIGGGTVAAIFRRAGYKAAVWSTIDDLAHQPNEYCVIDNMINDAKVFAHVCLQEN